MSINGKWPARPGNFISDETRKKLSAVHKGKKYSPERVAKIREGMLRAMARKRQQTQQAQQEGGQDGK